MTQDIDRGTARRDTVAGRRYAMEFLPGAIGFVVLFIGIPMIVDIEAGTPWSVIAALLPILPVIWMAIAAARHVARADEFQRTQLLTGFAIGFGAAMLTAIVFALLSTAGIVVPNAELYVFVAGMIAWGASLPILFRR